jgi:hypothetical protein
MIITRILVSVEPRASKALLTWNGREALRLSVLLFEVDLGILMAWCGSKELLELTLTNWEHYIRARNYSKRTEKHVRTTHIQMKRGGSFQYWHFISFSSSQRTRTHGIELTSIIVLTNLIVAFDYYSLLTLIILFLRLSKERKGRCGLSQ